MCVCVCVCVCGAGIAQWIKQRRSSALCEISACHRCTVETGAKCMMGENKPVPVVLVLGRGRSSVRYKINTIK